MKERLRILFVLPSLRPGGAERVISYISQNISRNHFIPKLVIIESHKDAKHLVTQVETIFLNKSRVLNSGYALYKLIRQEDPQIILGAMSHVNLVLASLSLFFPNKTFIGREVNVLSVLKKYSSTNKYGAFLGIMMRIGYRLLDKVICQSNDMKLDLISLYGLKEKHLVVINNPISESFKSKEFITPDTGVFKLITVGRLAKQKGYDRLITILSKLEVPFQYTIIGEGPEKENILSRAQALGIAKKIIHIPYTSEVSKHLSESHVYLQGSYVEGFPNALVESLAIGTPAVVFNVPGGINEIMIDGVTGYVADSEMEFLIKTRELLYSLNEWDPNKISETIHHRFGSKKILKEYETFLQNCVYNN